MSHASLATPFAPAMDPALTAALRRAATAAARATAWALGSFTAAALAWLLLAGPGFMSDRASTGPARHIVAR